MVLRTGLRRDKTAATRLALIAAARRLFTERGYHATGTPEVASLAGLTRGALYHHFDDKEALFEAVFRELSLELEQRSSEQVREFEDDRWRQLNEGLQAFLQIIADRKDLQRVLILDGPVVLGWAKWRDLNRDFILGYLIDSFEVLMGSGFLRPQPLIPLSHLILAALNEAALLIAHADDPRATGREVAATLGVLLAGLR